MMKKNMMALLLIFLLPGLFLAPCHAAYLFDTGTPDTSISIGSYDLKQNRPIIAVQFTNTEEWHIDSIEGYFMTYDTASNLQVKIWQDSNTNIPGNEYLASAITPLQGNGLPAWQGVYGLNWTLPAGTWWVGFAYDSGWPAEIIACSPGFPGNSPREVQHVSLVRGYDGVWQWLMNTGHNYSLRIGEPRDTPLPAGIGQLGSWLLGWRD